VIANPLGIEERRSCLRWRTRWRVPSTCLWSAAGPASRASRQTKILTGVSNSGMIGVCSIGTLSRWMSRQGRAVERKDRTRIERTGRICADVIGRGPVACAWVRPVLFYDLGVFKLGWDAESARRCLQRFVRPGRHVGVPTRLQFILNTPL
jgi:hypothetical protein